MRRDDLDLSKYDTDKIAADYLKYYDPVLAPWLDKDIKLLELGVHRGGSLVLWSDYFPKATIAGIDLKLPAEKSFGDRIHLFEGDQSDTAMLTRVANEIAPDGYDIIIDDASHMGGLTKISFWHLFDNHLKPGGLYVIEDWGTGYWDDWPDGKACKKSSLLSSVINIFSRKKPIISHMHGMVGFVKELVDEQGAADMTRLSFSGTAKRQSKFENLLVTPSLVFVNKSGLVI